MKMHIRIFKKKTKENIHDQPYNDILAISVAEHGLFVMYPQN